MFFCFSSAINVEIKQWTINQSSEGLMAFLNSCTFSISYFNLLNKTFLCYPPIHFTIICLLIYVGKYLPSIFVVFSFIVHLFLGIYIGAAASCGGVLCVYVCLHVCVSCGHATEYVLVSEENLWKSIFCLYHVCPDDWAQTAMFGSKSLCPLSFLLACDEHNMFLRFFRASRWTTQV